MKYKVIVIREDEKNIVYEIESKTHLSVRLRTNKKLERKGIDIGECELKIIELEEEVEDDN